MHWGCARGGGGGGTPPTTRSEHPHSCGDPVRLASKHVALTICTKGSQPGSDAMVIPPSTIGTSVRARGITAGFSGEQQRPAMGDQSLDPADVLTKSKKSRGGFIATFALNPAYRYQT
jgi:hypothetical protein